MILYHGTKRSSVNAILRQGLQPRRERPSVWKDYPSISGHVYLTADLLMACRAASVAAGKRGGWGVVMIDLAKLDKAKLCPDEDWVARQLGGSHSNSYAENIAIQQNAIAKISEWKKHWRKCLREEKLLAHVGSITTEAIIGEHVFEEYFLLNFEFKNFLARVLTLTYDTHLALR